MSKTGQKTVVAFTVQSPKALPGDKKARVILVEYDDGTREEFPPTSKGQYDFAATLFQQDVPIGFLRTEAVVEADKDLPPSGEKREKKTRGRKRATASELNR